MLLRILDWDGERRYWEGRLGRKTGEGDWGGRLGRGDWYGELVFNMLQVAGCVCIIACTVWWFLESVFQGRSE